MIAKHLLAVYEHILEVRATKHGTWLLYTRDMVVEPRGKLLVKPPDIEAAVDWPNHDLQKSVLEGVVRRNIQLLVEES